MSTMAPPITGVANVCSTVCVQTQIKENIKAPRHWPLWGESTSLVCEKCFRLMTPSRCCSGCSSPGENHCQRGHFFMHSLNSHSVSIQFTVGELRSTENARYTITIRFLYEYTTLYLLHAIPYIRTPRRINNSKCVSRTYHHFPAMSWGKPFHYDISR